MRLLYLNLVFLWSAACYRIIAAQDDDQAYHYSSFDGPVSGVAEKIPVPRAAAPYPYKSSYEAENDMTFDYVAKPDYSFVYGVVDPEFGKSHKHAETRDGDVVEGEYSVVEPDGSLRRVVYTADAEHGFRATVTRTPPKPGWSLPPQPVSMSEPLVDEPPPADDDSPDPFPDDDPTFYPESDPTEDYGDRVSEASRLKSRFLYTTSPRTLMRKRYRYRY